MNSERLYYNEPYLFEFRARVVSTFGLGDRHGVVLDRTAFYPAGGGQPHDLGTIDGRPVLDCFEREQSGEVVHLLEAPPPQPVVRGWIDRERRTDHMQQHTGQHILSRAFLQLLGLPTVSFHMGTDVSTIDLPVGALTREQITLAEELSNRTVLENRAVRVDYVEAVGHEIASEKPVSRPGTIRMIDVEGYDRSPCGGTHVSRTGEIGLILVTRLDRAKKQTRLDFRCGRRATRFAREASRALETIGRMLAVPPLEAGAAVSSALDEVREGRKQIQDFRERWLEHEAATLPVRDQIVACAFEGRPVEQLKLLAEKVSSREPVVVLLADRSEPFRLVLVRSRELNVDVAAILKETLDRFGGKGGGRPHTAQGGGFKAESAAAVLEFAREETLRQLRGSTR